MLLKREINTDYLDEWPKHYHEIKDIKEREAVLRHVLEEDPSSKDDQTRLLIFSRRFETSNDKKFDLFMRGWINIKTLTTEQVHFFNRKKMEKELREYLKDLAVIDFERNELLKEEWRSFASDLILSCSDSHSYKQIAMGIGHVSDKNVAMRIASDIDNITRILPSKFSLEEECRDLNEIMIETYKEMIENGEEYWDQYCASLQ